MHANEPCHLDSDTLSDIVSLNHATRLTFAPRHDAAPYTQPTVGSLFGPPEPWQGLSPIRTKAEHAAHLDSLFAQLSPADDVRQLIKKAQATRQAKQQCDQLNAAEDEKAAAFSEEQLAADDNRLEDSLKAIRKLQENLAEQAASVSNQLFDVRRIKALKAGEAVPRAHLDQHGRPHNQSHIIDPSARPASMQEAYDTFSRLVSKWGG